MEGSGRGLILGTILTFTWRDFGKQRKILVRIGDLGARILTRTAELAGVLNAGQRRSLRQHGAQYV
jgi:hypothetical protein